MSFQPDLRMGATRLASRRFRGYLSVWQSCEDFEAFRFRFLSIFRPIHAARTSTLLLDTTAAFDSERAPLRVSSQASRFTPSLSFLLLTLFNGFTSIQDVQAISRFVQMTHLPFNSNSSERPSTTIRGICQREICLIAINYRSIPLTVSDLIVPIPMQLNTLLLTYKIQRPLHLLHSHEFRVQPI